MMTHLPSRSKLFVVLLLAVAGFSQQAPDPWPKSAEIQPAALASILKSSSEKPPVILCVAFPVLYHSKHIQHALFAGPTSKPEGMEALKKATASLAKDSDIVIYCGCCPMEKCPNVRPAYRMLKEMGFTHVRVLDIPTNMQTDWYTRNYPSESGSTGEADSTR
jgi:Rhodanese-like domain